MHSVPLSVVRYTIEKGEILPTYLGPSDAPWLRELIEVFETMVGARRREVAARLERSWRTPMFPLAVQVLWQLFKPRIVSAVPPRQARRLVFSAAARLGASPPGRTHALATAAKELSVDGAALLASLLADLPSERRLGPLLAADVGDASRSSGSAHLDPQQLALLCNTAVARAIVRRALRVDVTIAGNARSIVRHARLRGLICTVQASEVADCRLMMSGPLSLLKQTTRYGSALAELVPMFPWCRAFRFVARCRIGERHDAAAQFILTKGSPIAPSREPRRYDSCLEERFARDLMRATHRYRLTREPAPVEAAGSLIFPDFELVPLDDPDRRWWIELIGFWTPDYLTTKLRGLRAARLRRLILCVDESGNCAASDLPEHARLVWFRRRVDVAQVLAIVNQPSQRRPTDLWE